MGRFATDGDRVALHEGDSIFPLLDAAAGDVHHDRRNAGGGEHGERVVRVGDAHDEAVRLARQFVADDLVRELVARPVDDELPSVSRAQMLEDAVELVLTGDAGHPQRHDDAPRHHVDRLLLPVRSCHAR